ncbi:MAG: hypothetical protein OSJ76_03815 [Alphaproteobacteria bacterium]|nr:hypothetical protein [Alphaproteobacteria bacterium]
MSFNSKNFSVMAYANGFTLWNYTTPDALTDVNTAGYFNDIAPFARIGDMVLTVAGAENAVSPAILAVTSIADGVVAVSDFTSASAAA